MLTISIMNKATHFLAEKHSCEKGLLDYIGIWELPAREKKLALFNVEDPRSPLFRSTVAYEFTS